MLFIIFLDITDLDISINWILPLGFALVLVLIYFAFESNPPPGQNSIHLKIIKVKVASNAKPQPNLVQQLFL